MGSAPPIPARCAERPVLGGLVVPHISVVAAGRPVLGAVHRNKAMRCISGYLCQICGQALTRPIVVIVTAKQLADRYSPEAALHPECAAYSIRACPMLNGRTDTLRHPDRHIGTACDLPGCDCGGWTFASGEEENRRGAAVDGWWSVWLDDYLIAVNDRREVHGLAWRSEPRRVRHIIGEGGDGR